MWSIPTDRERAQEAEERARVEREFTRRQSLPVEDRIKMWREEPPDEEIEGVIELLCDAEEELRKLRGVPVSPGRPWEVDDDAK